MASSHSVLRTFLVLQLKAYILRNPSILSKLGWLVTQKIKNNFYKIRVISFVGTMDSNYEPPIVA